MQKTALAVPAAPRGKGVFVLFTQPVLVAKVVGDSDVDSMFPAQTDYIKVEPETDKKLAGWYYFSRDDVKFRWPLVNWEKNEDLGVKIIRR